MLLPLIAALVVLQTALPPADPQAASRAVIEGVFDAIKHHDAAAVAAYYAPDAVLITSDVCKPVVGRAAIQVNEAALFAAMPDLTIELIDGFEDGNRFAVQFKARSKALGPTGEALIADFFTLKDGKIVRDVTIFNPGQACR